MFVFLLHYHDLDDLLYRFIFLINSFLNLATFTHNHSPQVAILDFGSQYSHLIARRVREMNVYCELYSCAVSADELAKHEITAVILSGGPSSVYEVGLGTISNFHFFVQNFPCCQN